MREIALQRQSNCGIGLLEGPVSESGRLCHEAGGHEGMRAAGGR